jgi:3D (Asp-Asp-Asp) domain-containing protein
VLKSGERRLKSRARRGSPTSLGGMIFRASAVAVLVTSALGAHSLGGSRPIELPPAVVEPTLRLAGAIVDAKPRDWHRELSGPVTIGEALPVELTAYCLRGTTRRSNPVRPGIVAADPRVFPLGKYVEIYIGTRHLGRFLVDDTGGKVKGNKLDIWTPRCAEALMFGRRRGTAVLVARSAEPAPTPEVDRLR